MLSELDDLRKNELFAALTDDELSTLTPLCSRFAVIEDGLVFREGTEASYLYLVVEGQIALQRPLRAPHGRRSRRTTVAVCRPPEVVGWSALVWPYKYTLSAVGWESSRLVRVDASMLRKSPGYVPRGRLQGNALLVGPCGAATPPDDRLAHHRTGYGFGRSQNTSESRLRARIRHHPRRASRLTPNPQPSTPSSVPCYSTLSSTVNVLLDRSGNTCPGEGSCVPGTATRSGASRHSVVSEGQSPRSVRPTTCFEHPGDGVHRFERIRQAGGRRIRGV